MNPDAKYIITQVSYLMKLHQHGTMDGELNTWGYILDAALRLSEAPPATEEKETDRVDKENK